MRSSRGHARGRALWVRRGAARRKAPSTAHRQPRPIARRRWGGGCRPGAHALPCESWLVRVCCVLLSALRQSLRLSCIYVSGLVLLTCSRSSYSCTVSSFAVRFVQRQTRLGIYVNPIATLSIVSDRASRRGSTRTGTARRTEHGPSLGRRRNTARSRTPLPGNRRKTKAESYHESYSTPWNYRLVIRPAVQR